MIKTFWAISIALGIFALVTYGLWHLSPIIAGIFMIYIFAVTHNEMHKFDAALKKARQK